jgi:PAS domain S-box-containing protein
MSSATTSPHEELEERLRFETLIADLSSRFVNLPDAEVDREIMDAQRRICKLLGIDLSALWQWSDEVPGFFRLTHFYSAHGGPLAPGRKDREDFPWIGQEMRAGRILAISSLEELPAEAARDLEVARQLGIKSNLSLPLSVGGKPAIGVLGLSTTEAKRDWPQVLVKRLQLVAQIFANALARKVADQALRDSEELNRATFDQAAVGIAHVGTDGRWLRANDKLCAIVGYPREELLQLTFQDITHSDDLKTDLDHVRQLLCGQIKTFSKEKRYFRKDRSLVWVNLTVSLARTAPSEPRHFISVVEDITDRKRAEEAFRASEARLLAGTELAGLGYYEVDYAQPTCFLDERFRDICGIPPELRQGLDPVQFWLEHVHPDDRQLLSHERATLHGGKVDRIVAEYRYLHPANGQRWLHHSARFAGRSAAGAGIRTYGVVRDITPQKEAELEAQELRNNLAHLARVNTLGALSGSLAHELNQPLGIILSNAQAAQELLLQEPPDVAELQAILSDIVAADRRAGEVIERLRAMLKHGQVSLQPLRLNQVIEEVLHLTQADLIGRGVTVVHELAPDLPPIAGDRVQLQQLVLNLILNAADALATNVPGARRLHIQTLPHQGSVRASVRDEGSGLPADAERLFQPFYTTKPQGLGLGLAICRSIVAAHHGRLWAESHSERGAIFHFELPAAGSPDKP